MSHNSDVAERPRPSGLVVLLLGALTTLAPLAIDMYLPGLPALSASLGAEPAAGQRTVSIFFVGMAAGQLFHGPLADRMGRRIPLFGGIGLFIAASIGCATAQSMEVLLLMRLLQALGGCAGVVVARAVVRDLFEPRDTVRIFARLMLVLGVSPIFSPLIGGLILLVGDWRTIFWALAGLGALLLAAVALRLPESRTEGTRLLAQAENPARSYLALLRNRQLMGFVLVGAFAQAAMPTYVSASPSVLISGFHVAPQLFGWFFGVNGVGLIAGNQINAQLTRRYTPDVILKVANRLALLAALVLLVNAATGFGGLWGVAIPLFLLVTSMGFNQPNALAGAMAEDPLRAGATSALLGAAQFGIGSLCSWIASLFPGASALPMAAVITATLAAAVILFAVMRPNGARFAAANART